jgi:hypothetical protein
MAVVQLLFARMGVGPDPGDEHASRKALARTWPRTKEALGSRREEAE